MSHDDSSCDDACCCSGDDESIMRSLMTHAFDSNASAGLSLARFHRVVVYIITFQRQAREHGDDHESTVIQR